MFQVKGVYSEEESEIEAEKDKEIRDVRKPKDYILIFPQMHLFTRLF